jgi:hypothetical protein
LGSQDFDGPGNDGEDVIEVVGDTAGEVADDLHPLGLTVERLRGFCRLGLLTHVFGSPATPVFAFRLAWRRSGDGYLN